MKIEIWNLFKKITANATFLASNEDGYFIYDMGGYYAEIDIGWRSNSDGGIWIDFSIEDKGFERSPVFMSLESNGKRWFCSNSQITILLNSYAVASTDSDKDSILEKIQTDFEGYGQNTVDGWIRVICKWIDLRHLLAGEDITYES